VIHPLLSASTTALQILSSILGGENGIILKF
jgi:hypothetical protein